MSKTTTQNGRPLKKNNDHSHAREEWQKGKKIGRPKQQWVTDHWEKVGA